MTDKAKRKTNPRRRLLMRLLLIAGIVASLIIFFISLLEPEHDYLIYYGADPDSDSGIQNLYLFDATTGQDARQLSDFTEPYQQIYLSAAENAPYIAYVAWERDAGHKQPIFVQNVHTGHSRQIASGMRDWGAATRHLSIEANGRYLAYEYFDEEQDRIEIRLVNIDTEEDHLIMTRERDEYRWSGDFEWTDTSLIFTFSMGRNGTAPIIFRVPLDEITEIESLDFSDDRFPLFSSSPRNPSYAPDESRVIYTRFLYDRYSPSSLQVDLLDDREYTLHLEEITTSQEELGEYLSIGVNDWHPNSEDILLAVNYRLSEAESEDLPDSFRGFMSYSVIFNTATGDFETIMPDANYTVSGSAWNSDASRLLIRRIDKRCDCTETFIIDTETGERTFIPDDAYYWVGSR